MEIGSPREAETALQSWIRVPVSRKELVPRAVRMTKSESSKYAWGVREQAVRCKAI